MRILALETTETPGSVAVLEKDRVLGELFLPTTRRTTEALHPAIQELLQTVGWKPRDVQLVATCVGPGSFTGLRLGVTTAKSFAYCTGAEVQGLDTLEVIAAQVPETAATQVIWAVVDALRGDVVAGAFRREASGVLVPVEAAKLVPFSRWIAGLKDDSFITGPALERYERPPELRSRVVPKEFWAPRAATVGRLAWEHYRAGRRDDLWTLVPRYARLSYAEEKFGPLPGSSAYGASSQA